MSRSTVKSSDVSITESCDLLYNATSPDSIGIKYPVYPALTMLSKAIPFVLITGVIASPLKPRTHGNCPPIHIFGARETTVPPGYGSAITVVDEILHDHPASTSEAINYPACGGGANCGGVSYSASVANGTNAVVSAVSAFAAKCPHTELVLVGYSQGAEIFDNALCGGGDPNQGLTTSGSIASYNIKAAIFMGDPRFEAGAPYNVGSCEAGGFDARPAGQYCGSYDGKIRSYCDAPDPYCCNGNNATVHQGYGQEYGQAALKFVNSKLC
ncbi:carbohydrate esterase family 5 protein [Polychaeton citri CBS 116435]|uniref:Carbohydrate esterase family 5 protein n=1 Tax=Polychaeton citri CBS 116435 TaxID=1314669 RepID=A0A9P4PYI6_9PEZI|nr:carbohydrate esterase family 5 protein [Polychaeton citri CBS 116435]